MALGLQPRWVGLLTLWMLRYQYYSFMSGVGRSVLCYTERLECPRLENLLLLMMWPYSRPTRGTPSFSLYRKVSVKSGRWVSGCSTVAAMIRPSLHILSSWWAGTALAQQRWPLAWLVHQESHSTRCGGRPVLLLPVWELACRRDERWQSGEGVHGPWQSYRILCGTSLITGSLTRPHLLIITGYFYLAIGV